MCIFNCEYCAPNMPHYCRCCGAVDSHRTTNCPMNMSNPQNVFSVPRTNNRCRAQGCTSCIAGQTHYCKVCNTIDADHRSVNCPQNHTKIVQLGVNKQQSGIFCRPANQITTNTPAIKSTSTQSSLWGSISSKQKVATMTVLTKHNEKWYVFLSVRGKLLSDPDKLVSTGGGIDSGETAEQCAIRECAEEHGMTVNVEDIVHTFNRGTFAHHVAVVESTRQVNGPQPSHAWEIEGNIMLPELFGNSQEIQLVVTGIYMVPLSLLHNNSIVQTSPFGYVWKEFCKHYKENGVLSEYK